MSGPRTQSNGQIVAPNHSDIREAIGRRLNDVKKVVVAASPDGVDGKQMLQAIARACMATPKLVECSVASFAAAVYNIAALGLWPNDPRGHAYLIPFGGKVQLVIGYKGYVDLAYRSGLVTAINAQVVRQGDVWHYEDGLSPILRHQPKVWRNSKDGIIAAWAVARLAGGGTPHAVLSFDEIEARRKRGASGRNVSTPWDTDYPAMAMKTAIRSLIRFLPTSASRLSIASSVDEVTGAVIPGGEDVLQASGFVIDVDAEDREPGGDDDK